MKNCLITLILLLSFVSKSQNDVWLEGRSKIGFLIAHRAIMGHLATEHAFAGEFSYRIRPNGHRPWHKAYNYPDFGITGFLGTVGNRELMGYYYGIYGFMNFPLVKTNRYTFSGKLGSGLGYGTKTYDPDFNVLSMAVSSHFNAHICLALENRFEFGNHAVTAAIDMTHFSNGASKIPNLGLNLPFLSLGYGYRIKSGIRDTVSRNETFQRYWEFGAIGILSQKQVSPTGGRHYPVYGFDLIVRRYFGVKSGMELSLDLMSKQAIFGFQPDVSKTQLDILQLGLFAGYIMPLERLHFILGMGYYLRDKFQPEDPVYHRIGMRYLFKNGLNLNLGLKSHFARADYVEYGIGYTFKR